MLADFLLARIAEDEVVAQARRDDAECEAKRRIVAVCDDYEEPAPTVLRLLALPYADHPDYQEAWRP